MFRLLILAALIAYFSSCHNCACIPSTGLKLGFISFDSTEVDTIISRKFQKGTHFSQLLDTLQWDRGNVSFNRHNDTFQMGSFVGIFLLQKQYDYQVFIPASNRLYTITEINEPQRIGNCSGKVMCVNSLVSTTLNDTARSIAHDVLYLKK
jgi:hypothetical protein